MASPAFQRSSMRVGATALVAFFAAVIVFGLGGWQLVRTREAILRDAERNTGTLARALAQHAGRAVETVDLGLRDAVLQAENGRSLEELISYLHSRSALDQVFNLIITDASGQTEEVRGPGVVGEHPVLSPGETFQYTSGCQLKTSAGVMRGTY